MGTFGNNCLVNITCDVFPTQSFFLFRENSLRACLPKPTHQRDLPLTIECTSVFPSIRKKCNLIKIRSLFAPDNVAHMRDITKPGAIKDRILIRLEKMNR